MPYPRDYGIEHILTCEADNCQVRLDFTDFQLALTSTLEIFDSNGQMLDSYNGEHFRPPIIISSGKSLLLQFRGNGVTGVGFRAEVTFVPSKQLKDGQLVPYTGKYSYVKKQKTFHTSVVSLSTASQSIMNH